jgi:aspartokinase
MITVAEEVERIIASSPFLEEGLSRGIINCSALAREIQPQLEETLLKDVSESAILMAIKRLASGLEGRLQGRVSLLKEMGDLTVRSNLTEFTFMKSETIVAGQKRLLDRIKRETDRFVTFTQGVFETTVIVSASLNDAVEKIFTSEKLIARLDDLAAIVIKLPVETVSTPGVHYSILKQLAWQNINVVEVVSTYTELTVILDKGLIDRAFSALHAFLSRE